MTANTNPIYTLTPNIGTARITAQQVGSGKSDGSGTVGTDIFKAFTAGANGSYVNRVLIKPAASTAGTTTTNTSIRVYYSTVGSGSTTSGDTKLLAEINVPAQTAGSTTVPAGEYAQPINRAIPSGSFIHVGSGAAIAAGSEFHVTVDGGDY